MARIETFGTTGAGEAVHRVRLECGGLSANILTWGAVVQDLRLAGHAPPLVLGFDRFDDYPAQSPWFGAIAGRFANRIGGGRFSIDGREFQVERNWLGHHTLHGGAAGMAHTVWEIADAGDDFVTLARRDLNGAAGFPGNLDVECRHSLTDSGTFAVDLTATTDAPTPCSLAHHSYFNLDDGGAGEVLGHELQIAADAYLPVDADLIPTGEIRPVEGGWFDFREIRPIGLMDDGGEAGYDHNWCLAQARRPVAFAARAKGRHSGIALEVWTSEPGLQFYDGAGIPGGLGGLDGIVYGPRSGFCLEPQIWPDAPNRPEFPNAILLPGQTYRQRSEFRFHRR